MSTQMTGHNIDVTDALRDYTEKKLQRLHKHVDNITSVHITFNVDKINQIAEGQIAVPGQTLHAKAESETMYAAIDAMTDKLMRQLDKYKDKLTEHR